METLTKRNLPGICKRCNAARLSAACADGNDPTAQPDQLPAPGYRTAVDVRRWFTRTGTSINAWAREQGFDPALTYAVAAGRRKCLRGESHAIALALGLKAGPPGADRLS